MSRHKTITNDIVDQTIGHLFVKRLSDYSKNNKMYFQCRKCEHIWKTYFKTIKISKVGCPKCIDTRLNNNKVNERLKKYNIIILDNYINNNTKHTFKCIKCSFSWNTKLRTLLKRNRCPRCSGRELLNNDIIDLRLQNKKIKRIGNYIGSTEPIEFKCLTCNQIWNTAPITIYNKNSGCPRCYGNAKLNNKIIDNRLKNRDIIRLDDYINSRTKIRFQCLKQNCNHIWVSAPSAVAGKEETACPLCNIPSHNEQKILSILKLNKINFLFNYVINKIDNTEERLYRVDFYFPLHNMIIEYNGSQHYEATTCFGSCSKEQAENRLAVQQYRDAYIDNFCKNKSIKLIWIDGRNYFGYKLKQYMINEIIPQLKENK